MNFREYIQHLIGRKLVNAPVTFNGVYTVNEGFILKFNGFPGHIKHFDIVNVEDVECIAITTYEDPYVCQYVKYDEVADDDFDVYVLSHDNKDLIRALVTEVLQIMEDKTTPKYENWNQFYEYKEAINKHFGLE